MLINRAGITTRGRRNLFFSGLHLFERGRIIALEQRGIAQRASFIPDFRRRRPVLHWLSNARCSDSEGGQRRECDNFGVHVLMSFL